MDLECDCIPSRLVDDGYLVVRTTFIGSQPATKNAGFAKHTGNIALRMDLVSHARDTNVGRHMIPEEM